MYSNLIERFKSHNEIKGTNRDREREREREENQSTRKGWNGDVVAANNNQTQTLPTKIQQWKCSAWANLRAWKWSKFIKASFRLSSFCLPMCAQEPKKTANDEWQKNYKQQQQFGKGITAKKAERNGTNLSMITNNKPIYYALTANLWIYISSSFMIVSHFILASSVSLFFAFRCVQFCGRTFRSAQLHSRIGFRFVTKTLWIILILCVRNAMLHFSCFAGRYT